jgi:hypothetical protein
MQTIDLAQLTRVTGGSFGSFGRSQGSPYDAQYGAQPDAGQGGSGLLSGIDGFLGFLGSDGFQNIIGGIRQFLAGIGNFGGSSQSQIQPDMQGGDPYDSGMMQG